MRRYFGIGVYSPRTSENVGSLLRTALECVSVPKVTRWKEQSSGEFGNQF